jgi:alginate O-acetyltransferase complex protein AlgI
MVFDSHEFILVFLPIVLIIYNYAKYKIKNINFSKFVLIISSFIFFSYWNIYFLYLIIFSIFFNFCFIKIIIITNNKLKKFILIIGVFSNVLYLGVFKYLDFFINLSNYFFNLNFLAFNLIFPLAISFYTLQQIAMLFDVYEERIKKTNMLDYFLFVSFFPQLIAGPIVHYHETIPQFKLNDHKTLNLNYINIGIIIFAIGLFKKVILANNLGLYVDSAYSQTSTLNFVEAWSASFAFTFQLYFDFSGYTDMALGLGYMFNVKLPINFNSPFKSLNLINFWQNWHITLTRFINTYIYLALIKKWRIYNFNLLMICSIVIFAIIGFWHGPSIMFLLFGLFHGFGIVINHYFKKTKVQLNKFISFFLTFNFVNISFILFRSDNIDQFFDFITAMVGQKEILLHPLFSFFENIIYFLNIKYTYNWFSIGDEIGGESKFVILIVIASIIIFFCKNTFQLTNNLKYSLSNLIYYVTLLIISILYISSNQTFIYFNF